MTRRIILHSLTFYMPVEVLILGVECWAIDDSMDYNADVGGQFTCECTPGYYLVVHRYT